MDALCDTITYCTAFYTLFRKMSRAARMFFQEKYVLFYSFLAYAACFSVDFPVSSLFRALANVGKT